MGTPHFSACIDYIIRLNASLQGTWKSLVNLNTQINKKEKTCFRDLVIARECLYINVLFTSENDKF